MSQLENNTANLQAILDTVNNLPEASSGGGAVQVATGEFTPTSVNLYSNPITVSGLGFRPKYVSITALNAASQSYDTWSAYYNYLLAMDIGTIGGKTVANKLVCTNTGSAFSTGSENAIYYDITMTDDGFTLSTTGSASYVIKRSYAYVAIADSATVEEAVSAALEEVENGSY